MADFNYPDRNVLRDIYEQLLETRLRITKDLESLIEEAVRALSTRPTVKARTKDFSSYFKKYFRVLKSRPSSSVPPVITDLIGIRIVCPFMADVTAAEKVIQENFVVLETERKGSNYSFKEFGYESLHLLIQIPPLLIDRWGDPQCAVAEIQIRTILQDAWAEVEHELIYKAEFTPTDAPTKRKLAALNASLALADAVFQEVRDYQGQLNGQLGQRRESFFKQVEEVTDARFFVGEMEEPADISPDFPRASAFSRSIDDLLLNALYAHNKKQFGEAINFYTQILELENDPAIRALIYKHRGMANFARSHYEEAADDFEKALELDPQSYKAAYYRGVAYSVLQRYGEAIDSYTLALGINPYQPFCLYRRGQAYYHVEDYPQALADCEAALALEALEPAQKFRELVLDKLRM